MPASQISDEGLIAEVVAGATARFEELVRRYNQRLYRVARSILPDDQEAEDAVQEAYISAFSKLAHFEGRSSFSTWLIRITVNACHHRTRRSRPLLAERSLEAAMPDSRPSPEGLTADRELGRRIEIEIDTLPEPFRAVLVLRLVEGLSTAETAASLDLREPTVKTRLHRAKEMLRHQLGDTLEEGASTVHAFDGARCDRLTSAVMGRILTVNR